jgi:DNA polymerase III gamma/tau subunit
MIDVLRDAAVWKFTENDALLFRHAPSSLERMKELCAVKSREEWMFLLDIAFRSEKDVLSTEFPRLGFELLLLRLVNAPGLLDVDALAGEPVAPPRLRPVAAAGSHVSDPQPGVASTTTFSARPSAPHRVALSSGPSAEVPAKAGPSPEASARGEARKSKDELWEALLKNLNAKRKTVLLSLLSQMKGRREGNELVISSPHQFVLDRLKEEDKWPVLLQAVADSAGAKLDVRLVVSAEKKSPEGPGIADEEDRARRKALEDPLLSEVLREFEGATVLEVRPAPRGAAPAAPQAEPEADAAEEPLTVEQDA